MKPLLAKLFPEHTNNALNVEKPELLYFGVIGVLSGLAGYAKVLDRALRDEGYDLKARFALSYVFISALVGLLVALAIVEEFGFSFKTITFSVAAGFGGINILGVLSTVIVKKVPQLVAVVLGNAIQSKGESNDRRPD